MVIKIENKPTVSPEISNPEVDNTEFDASFSGDIDFRQLGDIASLERMFELPAAQTTPTSEEQMVIALSTGKGLELGTLKYFSTNAELNSAIADLQKSPDWQKSDPARWIAAIEKGEDIS